jgi:hypothetical protein
MFESFNIPGLWLPEHVEEIVGRYGCMVMERAGNDVHQTIAKNKTLTQFKVTLMLHQLCQFR